MTEWYDEDRCRVLLYLLNHCSATTPMLGTKCVGPTQSLFADLQESGFIYGKDDVWQITNAGRKEAANFIE